MPYPYTIESDAGYISKITLYNSYNGIKINSSSGVNVSDIYGTVLKNGIMAGNGWEYSFYYNLYFSNEIWYDAPSDVITNTPNPARYSAIDQYSEWNVIGIQFGQSDGAEIYNVTVEHANKDIWLKSIAGDSHDFYGTFAKLNGATITDDDYIYYNNLDLLSSLDSVDYNFAPMSKPATSTLYNVKDYGAVGDGITDDRLTIQNVMSLASSQGGGTVYLPPGQYKCSSWLSIPTGVELRGAYGQMHGNEWIDTTVLLPYEGKDTLYPETATAFLRLNAGSGVRGLSVFYPEQGFGHDSYPVSTYPYTVRAYGSDVWLVDLNFMNSYNGVDFAQYDTSGHIISGIWATIFHNGFDIADGAEDGIFEKVNVTLGNLWQVYRQNCPYQYGFTDIRTYTMANAVGLMMGSSENEQSFGYNSLWLNTHMEFYNSGSVCSNSYFWHSYYDTPYENGFYFDAGSNIHLIGPSGAIQDGVSSSTGRWLKSTSTFAGQGHLYTPTHYPWTRTTTNLYDSAKFTWYWKQLTYDDFESGFGNYTDGGEDCDLYTGGTYAHEGDNAANIQNNSGVASSFYHTNGIDVAIDVTKYSLIKVEFWYYPVGMENGEDFWVQFYNGSTWQTVMVYTCGTDFENGSFYEITDTDIIIDSSVYNFSSNMKIRFICDASDSQDDIYIDEVKISAK